MRTKRSTSLRGRQRGAALVEALVGVLIFAFGIIGLVGLQVAMTRAQGAAQFRAEATNLGSEVLGTMWADQANLEKYNAGDCSGYQPCKDWTDKVASSLPGGTVTLVYTPASGVVDVTLTWSSPAEGKHSHVLSTSIR